MIFLYKLTCVLYLDRIRIVLSFVRKCRTANLIRHGG